MVVFKNLSRACLSVVSLSTVLVVWTAGAQSWGATGSVSYTYDALGRLTSASYDTGVCIAYTYDANGNRTSQKIIVVPVSGNGYWGCFKWGAGKWN